MARGQDRRQRLQLIADEVHDRLNDSTVQKRVGRHQIQRNDRPRRIVWYRTRGEFRKPKLSGAKDDKQAAVVSRDTQVTTRMERADVRIEVGGGTTSEENDFCCDELFDRVITALEDYSESRIKYEEYTIPTDEPEHTGEGKRGAVVVFEITYPILVHREVAPLAVIGGATLTCDIEADI